MTTTTFQQHSSTAHQLYRQQTLHELKQHPEWQRLQEWRQSVEAAAGHPAAAAAFVGRLPHDLIHHLVADRHQEEATTDTHHHHQRATVDL